MALNFEPDWVTIISSSRTSMRSEGMRYRLSNPAPVNSTTRSPVQHKERFAAPKVDGRGGQASPPHPKQPVQNEHKKPRPPRPWLLNVQSGGVRVESSPSGGS